jgi:organic radical activating enzyme
MKRFIECGVPISACTLRCHYCYVTHHKLFGAKIPKFPYSAEFFGKALSKERLGGTCLLNFCADGETLLPPEISSYIKAGLEQGHFVMVVTNGTVTKRFDEIFEFPEPLLRRLAFKFSFHYLELKKRNLITVFFNNIIRAKEHGCSFTLELTPSDELEPYINEIIETSKQYLGAVCHVTVARDEREWDFPILTHHSREEYKKIWSVFNSELFDYKLSVFGEKRREFCYAGEWSGCLNVLNGNFTQCYHQSYYKQNWYKNIDKPLKFLPVGNNCLIAHCHNAHSFIGLGTIPELNAPTYTEMRNRISVDGSEWLQPEVKDFFSSKLSESNTEYSSFDKLKINMINIFLMIIFKNPVISMLSRIRLKIKR